MNPDDLQSWFDLFLAVSAALAVLLAVFRWADRKLEQRIVSELKAATYQIRTDGNGGQSLKDLHLKVDALAVDLTVLKRTVVRLEDDVEGLLEDE